MLKVNNRPLSTIETFARQFASIDEGSLVQLDLKEDPTPTEISDSTAAEVQTVSVHALDVLAEIYAENDKKQAKLYLEKLADKYDTLRKGYWEFRIEKLQEVTVQ